MVVAPSGVIPITGRPLPDPNRDKGGGLYVELATQARANSPWQKMIPVTFFSDFQYHVPLTTLAVLGIPRNLTFRRKMNRNNVFNE